MIHRRISWQLERTRALPTELSGFRQGRSASDSIGDLASSLEEAKTEGKVAHIVFLDIHRAFDALPHSVILERLELIGVRGRSLQFVRAFLSGRTFQIRMGGHTSTTRTVTQGVPQGSVLSPLLFNIVMAGLPPILPQFEAIPVNCAIYADDVALWCTGPTEISTTVQAKLQQALNVATSFFHHAGLTLSAAKTTVLTYRPRGRLKGKYSTLQIYGNRIRREPQVRYLGVIIDDRVNWRPAVQTVLEGARKLLGALCRIAGQNWGSSQQTMMTLYRGLIVNRIMYALPLLNLQQRQWTMLETFHRKAIRICLGLPTSSKNVPTLVEASDSPLQLQAKERALRQISRLAGTKSSYALLNSVTARPSSHFGKVAQTFLDTIGCPENVPPIPPPHREDNHLKIATDIVDLPRRKKVAETVARYIGNETISTYADMIHVYTDGSVKGDSATAAYVVPEMGLRCKDRLSNCTSSTTAEHSYMACHHTSAKIHKLNRPCCLH